MWLDHFGGIDEVVFYVFCAVSAIIVILAIANLLVSCCCTQSYGCGFSLNKFATKYQDLGGASSIDFNLVLGTILLSYTVLVRGLQTDYGDLDHLETLCQFYPAALIIGLTLFMGGLMVKSWGIFLFNKYNGGKSPLTEEWKPNLWIWFLLIIAGAVSVAWCVEFTPMLEEMTMEDDNMTLYACMNENGHDFEWQVSTSVWHAFLLFMAALAILPNCAASKNAEANILSLVTINTLFAVVAGICLYFLYDEDDTINYAINGALILWFCLFANIMFLASKILGNRRSKGMSDTQDNYDTINSQKREAGARNDGYLEPEEGETFQY